MDLQIYFTPMALESKQFNSGDTVRATFSFLYVVSQPTTVTIRGVAYFYNPWYFGRLDRVGTPGTKVISLEATTEPKLVEESVDFILSGVDDGTYGLLIEAVNTPYSIKADDVILVGVGPNGGGGNIITQMFPMIMMIMMLGLIMPMLTEGEAGVVD